jgi:hypothetical protein
MLPHSLRYTLRTMLYTAVMVGCTVAHAHAAAPVKLRVTGATLSHALYLGAPSRPHTHAAPTRTPSTLPASHAC